MTIDPSLNQQDPTPAVVHPVRVHQIDGNLQSAYYSSQINNRDNKVAKYLIGGAILIALTVVLAAVLYWWASELAEDEIVGEWSNSTVTMEFKSDGSVSDSTGVWNEWRVSGDTLYLVDDEEPEYEYYFKYAISDEVLFIAPLDYDDSIQNIHSYYQSDSYLSELNANLKFKSIHFNSSQLFKLNNIDNSSYSDLNKRDFTFSSSESISYRGELLVSEFSIRQEISTYHSLIFIPSYSTQYKHRNLTIRGRINENFRSPSFNDRFWIGVGSNGNVDLKAETALNKEIGLDYTSENVIHKITFFSLYVDNWIMWRQQESGNWIPENIKEVHSRGIEWKSVYKNDIFFHELNYQYNLSTNQKGINNLDASVGKQLIYTPIHKANFTSVYNIKNFKLLLNQSFNGKVYTSSDNLDFLDHNYIVNTTIKYHIKGIKSDVSLIVNNIGNTEYQTYQNYPNSGREFIFKLNININ